MIKQVICPGFSHMKPEEKAEELLIHYFREAGIIINSQAQFGIGRIVDLILEATRNEMRRTLTKELALWEQKINLRLTP